MKLNRKIIMNLKESYLGKVIILLCMPKHRARGKQIPWIQHL